MPHRPSVDEPDSQIDHEPTWMIPINHLFARQLVDPETLHLSQATYLRLVDQTGRLVKAGKKGSITPDLPPLLDRIGISAQQWQTAHCARRQIYGTGTYLGKAVSAAKEMFRRGLKRCTRTWLDPEPLAAPPPS